MTGSLRCRQALDIEAAIPLEGFSMNAPDYLNPEIPANTKCVSIPIVDATAESLRGYGCLVESPDDFSIEIVRWPAKGWRPVDADSGDEGGTTEGIVTCEWRGDILFARNEAVGGHYIIGYAVEPWDAREDHREAPRRLLLWHANYHPDGGQLFFPLDKRPFLVPLALPTDDVQPHHFVCFRFSGTQGLYIHPDVWHEGVFALAGTQRFFDKQGAVHARVSVDFPREFRCLLEVNLDGADER
jgi:Ureidoglycolate lyase